MSTANDTLYCVNHPTTPTSLRCNRCEKPICSRCAVQTPTGYRCRECIGNQQRVFSTALWYDYLLAFGVSAILSLLGSIFISILPIAFLTILIAPIIGTVIGEAARTVTRKRRSKNLTITTIVGVVIGTLPLLFFPLIVGLLSSAVGGRGIFSSLFPLLWQGVYLFMAASSAYYRISGIRVRY